ncbi:MAG TPA: riboflavin synthase [Kofleriaceae bacterium]|nr:riboflavin synthase [Kofleriaceae bacterium]
MFTGLVEDVGSVIRADRRSDALVITVRPTAFAASDVVLGESISHDGVCLTVTETSKDAYQVLAGAETLARTTIGDVRIGSKLNLERALRVGDRLGGHMVAGHVDGVGEITARRDLGANIIYTVRIPQGLAKYIVEKGSIAIDGISLTVNRADQESFDVAIIPHTASKTTLTDKPVGRRVNLEVDVIGKYVEKMLGGYRP